MHGWLRRALRSCKHWRDVHASAHYAAWAGAPAKHLSSASSASSTLLSTATGVWWLIYFSRASVRALFVRPAFAAYGYPLDATLPVPPLQKSGRFSNVPVLIVILACLLLVSALSCAILALTPFPAFFFGVIFSGFASHIIYLTMAIFTALIGYGLLRLDSRARIATIFVLCLGPINSVSLLLPSGRAQFNLYNQKVMEMFRFRGMPPTPMPDFGYSYVVMSSVMVVIFNAALFWILYRYRGDFQRTPPPPLWAKRPAPAAHAAAETSLRARPPCHPRSSTPRR